MFFIRVLRQNYPSGDSYFLSRECRQFFDLFVNLISESLSQLHKQGVPSESILEQAEIKPLEILAELMEKLRSHASKETMSSILEDKVQIGFMGAIEKLITLIKPYDSANRLADIIEPMPEWLITSHLFPRDGVAFCRSMTKESRAASYSLLLKTIECLEPKPLAEFLEGSLWRLLEDVQRPKKWKFVPAEG